MKKLYVIAGPNGAGKTTFSYTVLPEILDCKEFVNADEIAKGLSPFQPEKASIEAGRIMLQRINSLMESGENFAFETTLSSKSFITFIHKAKDKGYETILLFFYLNSPELALKRVKTRVAEGGHNIPEDVIRRRYKNGLVNFFKLYKPILDKWIFVDNSKKPYKLIARKNSSKIFISDGNLWNKIIRFYDN
ncbi:zeta toxin family protein [Aquiflexum sp. LQ15W]|uniref:zeta toxin family protein n=1 Tax=Cognataquiflexum nitidum TaxID=2922272 RepID=UPI001F137E37|nr:zeta toxin family protein [Cognataquiflexum nitidum]MCH6197975.1 zeta toxin family protein [Cognataquiflexum nitidum]